MSEASIVLVLWCRDVGRELAHHLIRAEARRSFGIDDADLRVVNLCARCGSTAHGRPVLSPAGTPPTYVTISRSDDLTVVALTDAGPVGVDVERCDAATFDGFDGVGMHPLERPRDARGRTITWVRKESLLKATGHGLTVDPTRIRFTDADAPPALLAWEAPDAHVGPIWVRDIEIGEGSLAAVTVLADHEPELLVRQADPGAARPRASC